MTNSILSPLFPLSLADDCHHELADDCYYEYGKGMVDELDRKVEGAKRIRGTGLEVGDQVSESGIKRHSLPEGAPCTAQS
jgi:hypothetical protein